MNLIEMAKDTFGSGSPQHVAAIAYEVGDLANELAKTNDKVFRRRLFGLLLPSATTLRNASDTLLSCLAHISSLEAQLLDIDDDGDSGVATVVAYCNSLKRSFLTLNAVAQMMESQWTSGTNHTAADLNPLVDDYKAAEQARLRHAPAMNALFTAHR